MWVVRIASRPSRFRRALMWVRGFRQVRPLDDELPLDKFNRVMHSERPPG